MLKKKNELWDAYNENIEPVIASNKLGCVLFQFQAGFIANEENRLHLLDCRRRLSSKCKMAGIVFLEDRYLSEVEFRSKTWLLEPELSKTVEFLTKNKICFACSDEPALVPIILRGTTDFAYIRVHRRVGSNRILSEVEIEAW